MILYSETNFLRPLNDNEYKLILRDVDNIVRHSIDTSRITSSAAQGLLVILKIDTDSKVIGLEFSSQEEAKAALAKIQTEISKGVINANRITSVQNSTPITLDDFNGLNTTTGINSYTFYTVEDVNDTFGLGAGVAFDIVSFGSESTEFIAMNKDSGQLYRLNPDNGTAVPLDGTIIHEQIVPALIWDINHPFTKNPSVTIVDLTETINLEGFISYPTTNSVRISFGIPVSGKAYLN